MARFLSMKDFADKKAIAKCVAESVEVEMGQIIGHVTHVTTKEGTLPNGDPKVSYAAHGEFEAVNTNTGELLNSGTIYLPDYYARELAHALEATSGNVLFGVRLSVRPTGKTIPYSWNVTNVTGIARSAPLEGLKRLMHRQGVLKVAPPMDPEEAKQIMQAVNELSGGVAATGAPVRTIEAEQPYPQAQIGQDSPTEETVDYGDNDTPEADLAVTVASAKKGRKKAA